MVAELLRLAVYHLDRLEMERVQVLVGEPVARFLEALAAVARLLVDGDTPNIRIRETDKLAGELLTLEEMRMFYLAMESWSQIVYDRLTLSA